jgi:hypothetical protein
LDSFLFTAADIKKPEQLADKLRLHADPISELLWNGLSASTKETLETGNTAPEELRKYIKQDFNRILQGDSIYDPIRFENVSLTPDLRELVKRNIDSSGLICLNRLLLQQAYPTELSQGLRLFPDERSRCFAVIGSKRRVLSLFNGAGKQSWSVNVLDAIHEPIAGVPEIRNVRFSGNLFVTVGKHTHVEVATATGAVTYLGSD